MKAKSPVGTSAGRREVTVVASLATYSRCNSISIVTIRPWTLPSLASTKVGAHPVGFITEGRDLPWLAESDVDGNGLGDIRDDSWQVAYRDVVVVDQQGEMLERYNLTSN